MRGTREGEIHDDRKGSPTTIPTGWTSTGQSRQQTSKPPPRKPTYQPSNGSLSTTVLPDTVHAPEPTEEPCPIATLSTPRYVSSAAEETATERPAPSKFTRSQSSLWERILDWATPKNEAQKGIHEHEVPQKGSDLNEDPASEELKPGKHETAIEESDFTIKDSSDGVGPVPTDSTETFSSTLDEGKESSKLHEITSEPKWLDISGEDDQPAPSFTTDLPPDVVFTDPARPGETLNMEDGFWVMVHPLGFEYNCWIRSRTADCTSTVWTTVTAEPTAKPKVTEGPWKSIV